MFEFRLGRHIQNPVKLKCSSLRVYLTAEKWFNYFHKILYLRCLKGCQIRLKIFFVTSYSASKHVMSNPITHCKSISSLYPLKKFKILWTFCFYKGRIDSEHTLQKKKFSIKDFLSK